MSFFCLKKCRNQLVVTACITSTQSNKKNYLDPKKYQMKVSFTDDVRVAVVYSYPPNNDSTRFAGTEWLRKKAWVHAVARTLSVLLVTRVKRLMLFYCFIRQFYNFIDVEPGFIFFFNEFTGSLHLFSYHIG